MWICNRCGNVIEERVLLYDHVPIGGRSYPVKAYDDTCMCGGEFVEAECCGECGDWCRSDDLTDGMCSECFDKKYNADYAVAHDAKEFLFYVFGDEAVQILARELKKRKREDIEQAARSFYREVL